MATTRPAAKQRPAASAGRLMDSGRSRAVRLRGRYDAAQTTSENAEHWAWADDLSARAANSLGVRRTLRKRARYEAANNCYLAGMLLTLANHTIGSGPRLQMGTTDSAQNQAIEADFLAWARDARLAQKLRTVVCTKKRDGEAFLKFVSKRNHISPVWLDLEVIEGDQVHDPSFVPDKTHVDGIAFDSYGEPETYFILDAHPGDDYAHGNYQATPTDASQVMHWFREDRPGARRGVPEVTPALPLFAQLRRWTLAVLTAAETAADHAGVLQATAAAPDDTDGDLGSTTPFDDVAYTRGMLTAVPFGWQLSQLRAEHPTTTYPMFKQELLNEIARCLNIPFNIAAGNSSGYNYSSSRLDHGVYFQQIALEQIEGEHVILDRIFRAWYAEARLIVLADGTPYVPPDLDLSRRPWSWAWDPAEEIDPNKAASAQQNRLESGMSCYQDELARQGQDWLVVQTRQAEALGIPLDQYRALLRQKLFGTLAEQTPAGQQLAARRRRAVVARRRHSTIRTEGGV